MARLKQSEIKNLQFQTIYSWSVAFTGLGIASTASNGLNLRAESVEVPKRTNNAIEIRLKGHKTKQPGQSEYAGSLTLTFTETEDGFVRKLLADWAALLWDGDAGTAETKQDSTSTMILTLQNSKGEDTYQYTLEGVYLEDDDKGSLSADNDIMKPSGTFSYDIFTEKSL